MPSDLPSRPELSKEERETQRIIDPTDRVKSVADKTDPRFEAAKQKVDKEERLRELRAKSPKETDDEAGDDEGQASDQKSTGFSFKDTGEPPAGGAS